MPRSWQMSKQPSTTCGAWRNSWHRCGVRRPGGRPGCSGWHDQGGRDGANPVSLRPVAPAGPPPVASGDHPDAAMVLASGLFDAASYQGLAEARDMGLSPVAHYLMFGEAAGFTPSPAFDPSYYAAKYSDIAGPGAPAAWRITAASADWKGAHAGRSRRPSPSRQPSTRVVKPSFLPWITRQAPACRPASGRSPKR